MSDPSPPVRVTRARAAAKADPKLSIATAASKAKVTRATATTASAAAKRRTRNDDHQDEEQDELAETMKEIIEPEAPKTRGRQKKAIVPEPAAKEAPIAPKARGRPKKETADAPEPTRTTRGRAKKVPEDETAEDEIAVAEPVKRATRGRAATVTKPAAPKKTVKFQESGKENIAPTSKAKPTSEVATGLKAKPVRKPASATTTTRATRGRAKVVEEPKSSPLSPKKVTQVATAKDKDNSDDELATTEKTPMPLMKSPMKPPGSLFNAAKKIDFTNTTTLSVHKVSVSQDLSASIMASPARRPPQSPFKDAMKASPQKLVLGDSMMMRSPFKPSFPAPQSVAKNPDPKASLLQSPARRPQSPMKVSESGSPNKLSNSSSSGQTPKASTFKISRFGTPKTVSRTPRNAPFSSIKTLPSPVPETSVTPSLKFSGRLSSIMPREADPSFESATVIDEETDVEGAQAQEIPMHEAMALDDEDTITVEVPETNVQSPQITCKDEIEQNPAFCLREQDESPFDSDSEDELASESPRYSPVQLTEFNVSAHDFASSPASPTPFNAGNKTPKNSFSSKRAARRSEIGFTPLARQLSTWMASSPESDHSSNGSEQEHPSPLRSNPLNFAAPSIVQESPAKSTFFEDEMLVRDDIVSDDTPIILEQDPNFSPVELIEEDLELAAEADEMSVLEPNEIAHNDEEEVLGLTEEPTTDDQVDELVKEFIQTPTDEQTHGYFEASVDVVDAIDEDVGPAPSEASQEYGDENAIPIDPTLLALPRSQPAFATPKRVLTERVCHTVSKVPLKPAAEESPMKGPSKKRSASISRLPVSRPSSNLSRSNTVISYSPSKSTARQSQHIEDEDVQMADAPVTPSRPAAVDWSTVGTPARTPRRDLNATLLKGAVVFVDVHTSEGADASVLFTELLTEMGARCVKTWNWTPTAEDGSKIGITHVVFKDGGRRTLEKARATGGVVACVGVGWVLDCERENQWLDEASYAVDTAEVPRGGHRRRKSMEPRALANLNGVLMTPSAKTPGRNSPTKESFGILETPGTSKPVRRRESVQWVRSPASSNSNEDHLDDQTMALSPIPATPGPDTISAYGEAYLDQLNAGEQTPGGAETPYFLHKDKLVQMTAPPKQRYDVDGNGVLSEKKDESVMMRLMAARRKSLQWAPKIGSPLAKSSDWGF